MSSKTAVDTYMREIQSALLLPCAAVSRGVFWYAESQAFVDFLAHRMHILSCPRFSGGYSRDRFSVRPGDALSFEKEYSFPIQYGLNIEKKHPPALCFSLVKIDEK